MTEFSLANNLAAIVTSMSIGDQTQSEYSNLKELMKQDFGFSSEPLKVEHKEIVVDMISRSFANKGDLTTLANVSYESIAEQVSPPQCENSKDLLSVSLQPIFREITF